MSDETQTPAVPVLTPRNNSRRLLLGVEAAKAPPSRRLTIPVLDPSTNAVENVEVEVRTPSYDQLREVSRLAKGDAVKHDLIAAVMCTFIPGTKERVLDVSDVDVMSATALGSFVNALVVAVKKLVEESQEDAEAYSKSNR